jgi:hypothetical protein
MIDAVVAIQRKHKKKTTKIIIIKNPLAFCDVGFKSWTSGMQNIASSYCAHSKSACKLEQRKETLIFHAAK